MQVRIITLVLTGTCGTGGDGTTLGFTPPKFNIATEKWWLEDDFPIEKVTFQGLC